MSAGGNWQSTRPQDSHKLSTLANFSDTNTFRKTTQSWKSRNCSNLSSYLFLTRTGRTGRNRKWEGFAMFSQWRYFCGTFAKLHCVCLDPDCGHQQPVLKGHSIANCASLRSTSGAYLITLCPFTLMQKNVGRFHRSWTHGPGPRQGLHRWR